MKNGIIMYSTGCPRCLILKRELDKRGIKYTENNSIDEMCKLGINSVPVLCVDGDSLLDYNKAIAYVMNYGKGAELNEEQ